MLRPMALLFSGLLLCACGGSEPAIVQAGPVAQTAADTSLSVFDGRLLPARGTTLRLGRQNGEVRRVPTDAGLGYDSATQELRVRLGTNTRSLDLTGNDPEITITDFWAARDLANAFVTVTVVGDPLRSYTTGLAAAEYVVPFNAYVLDAGGFFIDRTYGVVGLETPSSYLARASDSATYRGDFRIEAYRSLDTGAENRHILDGETLINVDFGDNRVIGGTLTLTDEIIGTGTSQPRSGTLAIGSAQIEQPNAFSAPLSSNAPGLTLDSDAALSGGFYGNTAQNVGGAIVFSGALDGSDVLAGGSYVAVQE